MDIDLADLPDNVETLQRMVRTLATERANLTEAQAEIERLRLIVQKLQRSQFGRRAERLDDDQLQFGFEDLHADIARVEATLPSTTVKRPRSRPDRPSLPAHLPREDMRLDLEHQACPCCGGELHVIGETVNEMLDHVPARLRVIRICRPRYGCRACGTIHQAPAPERPIAKGLASPGLLAHVLVAKYCDHLPLYRQSQIFARHGVDIDRSTLANWVGGACWWLEPLQARLAAHVFGSTKLFADDTPIPVLDPGRGRTKTGRLWVHARDDRPWRMAKRQCGRCHDVGWWCRLSLSSQDVEHDIGGMDAVSDRLSAGGLDCWQSVGQHRIEDVDHLAIAIVSTGELAPYTLDRRGQYPILEGSAIAQSTGFAHQYRHVVPRVVNRLAAAE
jgi:transposase